LAELVPEALHSPELKALLVDLAQADSQIFTLGCDLGAHEDQADEQYKFTAGGYVQLMSAKGGAVPSADDYLDYEQGTLSDSEHYLSRQVQRIEQGMGRGIRSNEDSGLSGSVTHAAS